MFVTFDSDRDKEAFIEYFKNTSGVKAIPYWDCEDFGDDNMSRDTIERLRNNSIIMTLGSEIVY